MSNSTDTITENKPAVAYTSGWVKISLFVLLIIVLLGIAAFGYGYQQFMQLAQRTQSDQQNVSSLQSAVDHLKQMLRNTCIRLNCKIMNEVK